MKEAHQKNFIRARTELPDTRRTPPSRSRPVRACRCPLVQLALVATIIIFHRSFCSRPAHALALFSSKGLVEKLSARRALDRPVLGKASCALRYGVRGWNFRSGPGDRRHASTVRMQSAYRRDIDAHDQMVKICDGKQTSGSYPSVRLSPPSFASLEPKLEPGCSGK